MLGTPGVAFRFAFAGALAFATTFAFDDGFAFPWDGAFDDFDVGFAFALDGPFDDFDVDLARDLEVGFALEVIVASRWMSVRSLLARLPPTPFQHDVRDVRERTARSESTLVAFL